MIQIPNQSGIQMLDLRPVVECLSFRTASEYHTICRVIEQSGIRILIMKTGHFCPVFKWSTSLDRFIIEKGHKKNS